MDEIYRIKDQHGKEFGPLPTAHVLALIDAGLVDAKAEAKTDSKSAYVPIAALDMFSRLFESSQAQRAATGHWTPPALPSVDLTPIETPPETATQAQQSELELPDLSIDILEESEDLEELIQITSDLQQQLSDCLSANQAYEATWVDYWNFDAPEENSIEQSDEDALIAAAWSAIEAAEYSDAVRLFDALAQSQPNVPSHQAGASYARFLRYEHHTHKIAELTKVEKLAASNPGCARTLICAARMNLALNRPRLASDYLAQAHNLHPDRADIKNALDTADHLISRFARARKTREPKSEPASSESPQQVHNAARVKPPRAKREKSRPAPTHLATILAVYVGVIALISSLGITAHLDVGGRRFDPTHGFFWARKLILLLSGLIGGLTLYKRAAISKQSFAIKPLAIAIALGLGAVGGFFSRSSPVEASIGAALGMTLFHVISEEFFFRFLIDRGLQKSLPRIAAPTLLSGVLFGLYHLSYFSVWEGPSTLSKVYAVGLITCFAGIPYAYLYHRTKSLMAPFICHLTVNVVATLLSVKIGL